MDLVLEERVLQVCEKIFPSLSENVDVSWGPGEIAEWDSINHLHLVMELTAEFGITLEFGEMMMMETLSDVQSIVAKKYNSKSKQLGKK